MRREELNKGQTFTKGMDEGMKEPGVYERNG
jgi:hypothetical protein